MGRVDTMILTKTKALSCLILKEATHRLASMEIFFKFIKFSLASHRICWNPQLALREYDITGLANFTAARRTVAIQFVLRKKRGEQITDIDDKQSISVGTSPGIRISVK